MYLKIASAFDREIKAVTRIVQRPLRIDTRGAVNLNAAAKIGANGIFVFRRRRGTRHCYGLISQGFKTRAITLETNGVHVGQIVGDDLHPHILRIKAGAGDVECSIRHQTSSFLKGLLCKRHEVGGRRIHVACVVQQFQLRIP